MGNHLCVDYLPWCLHLANDHIRVDQNCVTLDKAIRDGALPAPYATG
jgi:hypothetical protein